MSKKIGNSAYPDEYALYEAEQEAEEAEKIKLKSEEKTSKKKANKQEKTTVKKLKDMDGTLAKGKLPIDVKDLPCTVEVDQGIATKKQTKAIKELYKTDKPTSTVKYRLAYRRVGDYELQARQKDTDAWQTIEYVRSVEQAKEEIAKLPEPFIDIEL